MVANGTDCYGVRDLGSEIAQHLALDDIDLADRMHERKDEQATTVNGQTGVVGAGVKGTLMVWCVSVRITQLTI